MHPITQTKIANEAGNAMSTDGAIRIATRTPANVADSRRILLGGGFRLPRVRASS
jgi:hypothetical protein